jgi:glycosyltransferase involved in cell wall biosynthesis
MPRVSVIIPTFNCARFLGRALKSVYEQIYADYEVIVADDGSTDETRQVVSPYDGRITYLYQANRGMSSARNLALSKANGEFIAFLDADDMWYPSKLDRQVAFLDTHRECGLVHSDVTVIDEMDRVLHHRFNRETRREVPQGHCAMFLLRHCHIQVPSVVERRDCLEKTGLFEERLKGVEDYFQWISVAMNGFALGYIDEALAMYRWTPGSISSSKRRMSEGLLMMFEILLHEKPLAAHCGEEAVAIVRRRIYDLQRELAYLDRVEGRTQQARRRLLSLISDRPLDCALYVDLVKSCVPTALAAWFRLLKRREPA